jgi:hypothetical protein
MCKSGVSGRLPVARLASDLPSASRASHQAVISMVVSLRACADETRRVGGIADTLVVGLLRIRAQRPGESRGLGRVLSRMRCQGLIRCCDQHVRRDAFFDPSLQRENRIVLGVERDGCDKRLSELTAPALPRQWFIPGTMKSRSNCCTRFNPPFAATTRLK